MLWFLYDIWNPISAELEEVCRGAVDREKERPRVRDCWGPSTCTTNTFEKILSDSITFLSRVGDFPNFWMQANMEVINKYSLHFLQMIA